MRSTPHNVSGQEGVALRAIVPVFSASVSNHTDFDSRLHPQSALTVRRSGRGDPARVILGLLPGSKNACADLDWLRANGWEARWLRHLRYGRQE